MSCLLEIPEELLELILLSLQSPKDLLHLALTCNRLSDKIIPSHLNYIDISTDLHNSTFWETLDFCPRLTKRLRKLEILDEDTYRCAVQDGYKSGLRVRQTACSLTKCDSGVKTISRQSPGESTCLSTSLIRSMTGLHSLALKQRMTQETFYDILAALCDPSAQLNALSIVVNLYPCVRMTHLPFQLAPYHHLTSFALTLTQLEHLKPAEMIFDHIIFRCPSLINLSLVSRPPGCFCNPRFFKQGNWPSLRRLTLFGWLNLYPVGAGSSSPGANAKLAVAFFQRHPLLESLWIANAYIPQSLLGHEVFLHRSAFPSLRSLCATDQIPIQLLDQLHHMEDLEQIPLFNLGQAKMLRSCTFAPRHVNDIHTLAKSVPHLERLVFSLNDYTPCALQKTKQALAQLGGLTHLVIEVSEPQALPALTVDDFRYVIIHLPKLKFFQLALLDRDSPWYIIERERGTFGDITIHYHQQPDTPFADYHYQRWGDFFTGSLLDSYV